ncbi:uncharacterized protein (DUF885 family) [Chitinivorax tropicus]|uniref:Uncharacterized protein (DUF885 family) n=1 Tax=Chitinivorax tropicus TaxID=714531 RepID=A0A840MQZ4_9PROT|nr:DUF885 domain-containing protein [Chitinivorax tropicus]MBB5019517.1 uncharacterized protein (DUF885 family) [Chitinivorax tropicus]
MAKSTLIALSLGLLLPLTSLANSNEWVKTSDRYTQAILEIRGKYDPEIASFDGLESYDTQTVDWGPNYRQRHAKSFRQILAKLEQAKKTERDPRVHQDLVILTRGIERDLTGRQLQQSLLLPYYNAAESIYHGLETLLQEQNTAERKQRAIERLKRYIGMLPGSQPLTEQAKARTLEALRQPGLIGPYQEELVQGIDNTPRYLDGIAELFKTAKLTGWEPAHATLSKQLHDYDQWLKQHLQPRARSQATLPAAIYLHRLQVNGVDLQPAELIERSAASFLEIRDEMQALADQIAIERKLPSKDYREVLRILLAETLPADQVLPHYQQRLKTIEAIIRRERILSLPEREAIIRLATEAEAAATPSAQMKAPRLVGNTGERGEFLIPLRNPNAQTGADTSDDLNPSASWTLTAHEARPGHELQFARMIETGVSLARALFAEDTANVEGWALYSEALIRPYMPLEGQLLSLKDRMLRIARGFLDPMVNTGQITPQEAKAFLMKEVLISEAFAQQEADRYAFRDPGQATSYYHGYLKLRALRHQTEFKLGTRFDQQAFHDFILAQGLLPPDQLTEAVKRAFIPRYQ